MPGSLKRQIAQPIEAANAIRVSAGTTRSRTSELLSRPTSRTIRPPDGGRQDRRQRRPVDVRALDLRGGEDQRVHREAVLTAACCCCAGAIAELTEDSERRRPNWG